jgi:hypothetical protein
MVELATECPRYGYRMLTDKLHQDGQQVNHKRVYRLYRDNLCSLRSVAANAFEARSVCHCSRRPESINDGRWIL